MDMTGITTGSVGDALRPGRGLSGNDYGCNDRDIHLYRLVDSGEHQRLSVLPRYLAVQEVR